jgi:hypothetical protein
MPAKSHRAGRRKLAIVTFPGVFRGRAIRSQTVSPAFNISSFGSLAEN